LCVIVGVDGSPHADLALSWACRRARNCGDTVRAVCTCVLGASGEDWVRQPDVTVETVVVEGPPARLLVEMSSDADLLVIGTRGLGGFSRLLLGSVSKQCVHHAHCPVTVVR
jgi:nucleotide-binding universal stress UspA family protein